VWWGSVGSVSSKGRTGTAKAVKGLGMSLFPQRAACARAEGAKDLSAPLVACTCARGGWGTSRPTWGCVVARLDRLQNHGVFKKNDSVWQKNKSGCKKNKLG